MTKERPRLRSPTGKTKTIAAVHANAGIRAAYQKRLDAAIDEMHRSLVWWISAAYKANEPNTMAQDRSPAAELNLIMKRLARRWQKRFDTLGEEMGRWFAQGAAASTDAGFKAALRKGGLTVNFRMTAAQNDAVQAVMAENVGLIKSVAAEHLQAVQGLVMRSVAGGRDLAVLAKGLEHQHGVTKRRAAFISRDQNAKASAVIIKTRQQECGVTQARWIHSTAGRVPRPSHVKASKDGLIYNVAEGAFIDGKHIWPGTEPNCRCTCRSILPGVD